ncbi:hypothetical protein HBE96_10355 [Clostridium sp. P21]|uniref:Uncharacterized protein n=1 Tax=Clostridium muellerianum TaxID=2716538 RepID=A0A7Y0HPV4_9CLOT|nr:hypothetical protein [Clostridium muellerianum]NMM63093.1 hypothetical protein [Clostridium muellerianum]
MDISNMPPDTVLTEEMFDPQQGERFMAIEHHKSKFNEVIRRSTKDQLEAYRVYRRIKHRDKILVRAMVTYSDLPKQFGYDVEFILDYEIIEILEGR